MFQQKSVIFFQFLLFRFNFSDVCEAEFVDLAIWSSYYGQLGQSTNLSSISGHWFNRAAIELKKLTMARERIEMRIEPTAGQTVVSAAHHHIGRAHASLSLLLLLLLFICCCFYSHIIPACCYFIGGAFVVLVVMFLFVLCGFVFLVFSSSRQSMASRRRWRPCSQLLECSQE